MKPLMREVRARPDGESAEYAAGPEFGEAFGVSAVEDEPEMRLD